MAIDFNSLLTDEQKIQLIQNRIAQFAAEAYQHSLNLETAKALESEEQVTASEQNITVLEKAIEVHKAELDKLVKE